MGDLRLERLQSKAFISGVYLIAQLVLTQDSANVDAYFNQALTH
jgi:hypothetical protein